jgi:hypothetical protein
MAGVARRKRLDFAFSAKVVNGTMAAAAESRSCS